MHDNKKILFTMHGKVAGGGHLGTLEIMDRCRMYNFKPVGLVNERNSYITALLEKYNIDYIYLPGYPGLIKKNIGSFLIHVFRLYMILLKEKISLIHLSDLITGHYGILAARLARIPSILHMKSLYWTKEYGWLNRVILSQASLIITISDAVRHACLIARLPESKTITIHDGVDLKNFYPKEEKEITARKVLGIADDSLVIGFVGRLGVQWKNEPIVYRIVGDLSRQIDNIVLLVVGGPYDGRNETIMKSKRLAEEIIGGKAKKIFLGNRDDVPAILPAMDIYLVPSKEEPFGRVVIEGMAAGLPVVGSNNGGIPEMITNNHDGFLRSPDDLNGWSTIAKTLIEDKDLRERIGKNARKTVEERFTLDKMIEKVAEKYFTLLKAESFDP